MKPVTRYRIIYPLFCIVFACALLVCRAGYAHEITSPDGRVVVHIGVSNGVLAYDVKFNGRPVIHTSQIGFEPYCTGVREIRAKREAIRNAWHNAFGERSQVLDQYTSLDVEVEVQALKATVQCRLYNEGFAFRFVLPKQQGLEQLTIAQERTEFAFDRDYTCWPVYTAQGYYAPTPISRVHTRRDREPPESVVNAEGANHKRLGRAQIKSGVERPLVVELDSCVVALGEAALIDFARMKFEVARDFVFATRLDSPAEVRLPAVLPWRYIRVAENVCRLYEGNDFLLNLNEPCRLADTSWIKPGKVIRSGVLTTASGKACIDFAVKMGLQYIEFDAGWYGSERDPRSDARAVNVEPNRVKGPLDLHAVIAYGQARGIGVILYVNRLELERRLDELLPLYKQWGVAGIKYGFIQVGSQKATAWTSDAIRKANEAQMLIDIHDEYRLTGNQRTWPGCLTVEGIYGNEEMPTSAHNCALVFTRYLSGPGDYTPCWLSNRVKNTRAHQLALAAVTFSPFQFLYWYDAPTVNDAPELDFWRQIPTVFDETKAIQGAIGQYATIARKAGQQWFVGSINAGERRTLKIPLGFLDPSRLYDAHIYADGAPDGTNRTAVSCESRQVKATDVIIADLAAHGGHAMRLTPCK